MLRHQKITLAVAMGTVVLTIFLTLFMHKGFFPQQDTGRLVGSIVADQQTSFQSLSQKMSDFLNIVRSDPGIEGVTASVSGSASGSLFVTLKPLSARQGASADDIINRLQLLLAHVKGANLF